MKKKEIVQYLKTHYQGSKTKLNGADIVCTIQGKEVFVKILKTSSTNQVTINSTIIWDIKNGKVDGVRYKTTSTRRINLIEFRNNKHKLIIFTNKPYKVLRYLNESDIIDVSDQHEAHGIFYTNNINRLEDIYK